MQEANPLQAGDTRSGPLVTKEESGKAAGLDLIHWLRLSSAAGPSAAAGPSSSTVNPTEPPPSKKAKKEEKKPAPEIVEISSDHEDASVLGGEDFAVDEEQEQEHLRIQTDKSI